MYLNNMIYYVRLAEDVTYLPWNSERGHKLKELRELAGLSRAEMAAQLTHIENASQRYIVKLEMGKGSEAAKNIESRLLIEICKLLNKDPRGFGYEILLQPERV